MAGPLYDVRSAGLSLGTLAGAIAGFGVTAIVLLSQADSSSFCRSGLSLREQFGTECLAYAQRFSDRAAIGFFFAVFGCTVAAIELIGVGAERESSPRSMAISICARAGFVISLAAIFWGLTSVAALAFGQGTVRFARVISLGWALAVPSLLGFVYVEAETGSREATVIVPLRRFLSIAGAGFLALFAGTVARFVLGSQLPGASSTYIDAVFGVGAAIVALGMLGVLGYGRRSADQGMSPCMARTWIAVCCGFIACLIQLLP